MVFLHYPQHLTDEEEMLMKRYAKLKKKKKALQALRAPKQEHGKSESVQVKRIAATSDEIKEQAKKLVKAGAIRFEPDNRERQSFKRKVSRDIKEPNPVSFQPFRPEADERPDTSRARAQTLYNNFANSDRPEGHEPRDRDRSRDRDREWTPRDRPEPPKKGNTIYISGRGGMTQEMLRETFSKYGNILNIFVEVAKNHAFITYENQDSADAAISERHQTKVNGIFLKVSIARNQPIVDAAGEQSKAAWASIAASHSQKGTHEDKRDMVAYDEDMF